MNTEPKRRGRPAGSGCVDITLQELNDLFKQDQTIPVKFLFIQKAKTGVAIKPVQPPMPPAVATELTPTVEMALSE